MSNEIKEFLITPFRSKDGINKTLVTVFSLINGIVLFNAIFHDPTVGYDSMGHLRYIMALARLNLPTANDTLEFFSPPLPYFLPSLIYSLVSAYCLDVLRSVFWAAKFAQLLNVLFSLGLTFYLIRVCEIIRPRNMSFKVGSLIILGMLPVYYKSFAFVRGEPLLAFLAIFVVYQVLKMVLEKKNHSFTNSILLGVSLGLLILSRQWGFLLFPAITVWVIISMIKQKRGLSFFLKIIILSFLVAFVVGGWFYLALKAKYGRITAFNRDPAPVFSLSNQPFDFYFGLGLKELFSNPIRPSFPNQFFPIFYSEIWGDYWAYFVVPGRDYWRHGRDWSLSNVDDITNYLGRVNLISLFATTILLAGFTNGVIYLTKNASHSWNNKYQSTAAFSLLQLAIVTSCIGYFWFLISYPNLDKGDTIKATYMLHLFPFASILSSEFLERIKRRYIHLYRILLALLIMTFLHNLPVIITRYMFVG